MKTRVMEPRLCSSLSQSDGERVGVRGCLVPAAVAFIKSGSGLTALQMLSVLAWPCKARQRLGVRSVLCRFFFVVVILADQATFAQSLPDETLSRIRFDQKLNNQVSLTLVFRDEAGKEVRLGDYFGR